MTIPEMLAQAVKLHQADDVQQAELLYRQVLRSDPNQPDALHLLGSLANRSGRPHVAIRLIRRALALRPNAYVFHSNLANACKAAADVAGAIFHYQEALRLNPEFVDARVYLSDTLMEQGQFAEALDHALEALRLKPDSAPAFGALGELAVHGYYTFSEDDVRRMQALLSEPRLSTHDASLLYFTLATYFEKCNSYDQAFEHYRHANDKKQQFYEESGKPFEPAQHRARIDRLIAVFTREFFAHWGAIGVPSEKPTFVVGMVRSGTTLVEQILSSHPQVFGAGELMDVDWISMALPGQLNAGFGYPPYHQLSQEVRETGYPDCLAKLNPLTIQTQAKRYLQFTERISGGKTVRIIDKMPHNYLHLGLIALLFPRARIIHCRRDVMDVCTSAYLQNFKWLPYAAKMEYLGFYFREYERLMAHWRRVLPLPIYEVVYEEMVANHEAVSQNLVAYAGLPWDENCLAFYRTNRPVQTASKLQVRQPIYTRSVARWKRFEPHLQPLRDALANPDRVVSEGQKK